MTRALILAAGVLLGALAEPTPAPQGRRRVRGRPLPASVVLALAIATAAASQPVGLVRIDGEIVPGGQATIDIAVEITEDDISGGQASGPLQPVRKRLTLLISAPGRIPLLDAQFPAAAPVSRFTVEPGDGRAFTNCVVTGFKLERREPRFLYSLRCEDVSP